jgi:hypothetical protein
MNAMPDEAICRPELADLARDPLVRLVMAADGVTEAAFLAVLKTAKCAVDARMAIAQHAVVARRRPAARLRLLAAGRSPA